jgi:glycosyltransferase involved in cell wall biosynthesis
METTSPATANCTFTVLLPVVRPPHLLPFAVASVLRQTQASFELFIICDGAPSETVDAARALAAPDPRVVVFPFPKGERHGELHRHQVLQQATGRYVCQIADDDQWFPDHLRQMERLLAKVEFGNVLHTFVSPKDEPGIFLADLADPTVQQRMKTEAWNFFGPTVSGYRLQTYRRMPVGWSPAPEGVWSDLFMWRKFLALEGISVGTRFVSTSLHFPASMRQQWSPQRRQEESKRYADLLLDPDWRQELSCRALSLPARVLSRAWQANAQACKELARINHNLGQARSLV